MKEFTKALKQSFILHESWLLLLYVVVGVLVSTVGIGITFLILYLDGTGRGYGQIGTLMSFLGNIIIWLVSGMGQVPIEFNLAVSMGRTRKHFVPTRYFVWMADVLVAFLIVLLTSVVEDMLYPLLYPNITCEMNIRAIMLTPAVFFAIILLMPAIILLFGALFLKFDNKFMWIFWGVAMLFNLSANKIGKALQTYSDTKVMKLADDVISFFATGPIAGIILVLAIMAAALSAVAALLLRKQRVTW